MALFLISFISALLLTGFNMLWHSPYLFGKSWRMALKKKETAVIPRKFHMIAGGLWFLTALIYSYMASLFGLLAFVDFVIFSTLCALGFSLPVMTVMVLFLGLNRAVIWIDGAYWLLGFVLIGLINYLSIGLL